MPASRLDFTQAQYTFTIQDYIRANRDKVLIKVLIWDACLKSGKQEQSLILL